MEPSTATTKDQPVPAAATSRLSISTGQSVKDARDLAAMGHDEALSRKFSVISMLSLAFCVLGTWSTFAQGLSSGLENGGPITILWGLVLVLACNLCIALSLGEMCSSMPTALGQAYWISALLQGRKGARLLSYVCAWVNTFGWWTLAASQIAFMTEFLLGMKVLFDNEWEGAGEGWLQFVIYLAITAFLTFLNLVLCRRDPVLPMFNNFVGICFVGLFFVFILAMVISVGVNASGDLAFQPASFVFTTWINQTAWSDGVTWFTGLVQAAYGLTAFDAAIHLAEEIPAPRKTIPRVLWLSVTLGAISGWIFMVACLFVIQSLDDVLDPSTGLPFMDLVVKSVGLQGGSVLLALFIFNGLGQGVSIMTTASRMTWGFARDGGLPFSRYFAHVDPVWKVPVRALCLQGVLIGLIGVLYTFASTVLEAILSVSTIALTISYALPIVALVIAGRDKLPPGGTFSLGKTFGPVANYVSLVYCAVTTVFFFFPGDPDPAPEDMNYAIAVFGIMLVVAGAFWLVRGRREYLRVAGAGDRSLVVDSRVQGPAYVHGEGIVAKEDS
ncbi:putative amino acid permease family protein [Microdochium trichocladiopsis]|uniref:Amino acid permease family protein n=1 Tax=Microdochium trichocladiopsis TaxID=1682393 RepID=A0A9P9BQ44_9PEZI|nr:putative amino acid permease family protein [Microdochium trichocladiopsis]KAH7025166.1 putative amino acid permease family protein [Microdochium trichocladiopsis]